MNDTKKVFILEDDPDQAAFLKVSLMSIGYEIVGISDTTDHIVEKISETMPSIIIADITLKNDESGIEAARQIGRYHDMPVIFTSANDDDETFQTASEVNPYGYLIKPINIRELQFTIELACHNFELTHQLQFFQSHLNLAQQLGNMGSWELNVENNELVWSDQIFRIFGLLPQQFQPSYPAFLERIHPDDRQRVVDAFNATRDKGAIYDIEHRIICPDGSVKYVHEIGEVIFNKDKPQRLIGTVIDITDRKVAEKKIEHLAYYDILTDLPNRILLQDRLNVLIAQSRRNKTRFAVLFVDLDGFKQVNDTWGHQIGDKTLVAVAMRLKNALRTSDTVARIAGDEFVALLDNVETHQAIEHIANKILTSLSHSFSIAGISIKLSASIGIAIYPENGESNDDLLNYADNAMYSAKHGGKNQISYT